jgi:hypothetical protein
MIDLDKILPAVASILIGMCVLGMIVLICILIYGIILCLGANSLFIIPGIWLSYRIGKAFLKFIDRV